jgi:undecaprenyl diphosphate synthase
MGGDMPGTFTSSTQAIPDVGEVPRHIAIIMDGNGRWAQNRGLPRWEGHREGAKAVREIVTASRRLGVAALTLYAFSEQNWARPDEEIDALMALLKDYIIGERATLLEHGIRCRTLGRTARLPQHLQDLLTDISQTSSQNTAMTLSICLSYGGREEIADTAQGMARLVKNGTLEPADITEATLTGMLPSLETGPVDLLIRTGGEYRISNFLIWAAAYAELYFCPDLWPEYGQHQFFHAIHVFQQRNRRFGRVENVEGPRAP